MNPSPKLLYVETDEEVTDLVDRLRELPDQPDVTFVIPERARALQSPMSFRLLKRYAEAYGKRVNVISADARVQNLSMESGFGAFPDFKAYDAGDGLRRPANGSEPAPNTEQESQAAPSAVAVADPPAMPGPRGDAASALAARPTSVLSGTPRPPQKIRPARFGPRDRRPYLIGAGAVLVLAFLAAIVFLPTASITLTVAGTPLKTDLQLIGAPGQPQGSSDHFATQVLTASESQTVQGTSTGQKQVAAVAASGQVVFTYRCSLICAPGYNIGQGAVVDSSSGKRYVLQSAVQVRLGSSVAGSVAATDAGASGNTDAHTITAIEQNQDPNLKVDNPQAISGGADARVATVISQSDWDAAKQAALDQLNPKVQQDITNATKGLHLSGDPQQAVDVKGDHAVGDEAGTFNLTVTVKDSAVGFTDAAVRQLLRDALSRKVPQGSELTADQVKTSYEVADSTPDGNLTLNGHAEGYTVITFSKPAIRARVKGHSPASARAFLQTLPNVLDVNVVEQPIGLPWLPFFTSRIAIQIQEVAGPATS